MSLGDQECSRGRLALSCALKIGQGFEGQGDRGVHSPEITFSVEGRRSEAVRKSSPGKGSGAKGVPPSYLSLVLE